MIAKTALFGVLTLLGSFLGGILFYFFISPDEKHTKKKQMEEIISLTINFILFIWIGKIILHFSTFLKDPFAILAFPSNAKALYVATALIAVNLLYRKVKHEQPLSKLLYSFIPIFLGSSFLYEFFQVVIEGKQTNVSYLAFLFIVMIVYVILLGKIRIPALTEITIFLLLVGMIGLRLVTNITIFHYRISLAYFVILLIIFMIAYVYHKKKKV